MLCNAILLQRHRDRISHLMDTLRSIIPPSEKKDMSSVLKRAIEHIHYLDEENKVRVFKQVLDYMLSLHARLTNLHISYHCHRH